MADKVDSWTRRFKNSRISEIRKFATTLGWSFGVEGIVTPFRSHSWAWDWRVIRARLLGDLKRTHCLKLAERRPGIYAGLDTVDVKAHLAFLNTLKSYHAKIILRVWTGVPMTREHRHTLNPEVDPTCTCGLERQSVCHLLFRCPDVGPPPPELDALLAFETCVQSALLLPLQHSWHIRSVWRKACMRIINILSQGRMCIEDDALRTCDLKGHMPVVTCCGLYSFCALCFISRRIRDMRFIASHPCSKPDAVVCREGDDKHEGNHIARLFMKGWKTSALRPAFSCVHCGKVWWATATAPQTCLVP